MPPTSAISPDDSVFLHTPVFASLAVSFGFPQVPVFPQIPLCTRVPLRCFCRPKKLTRQNRKLRNGRAKSKGACGYKARQLGDSCTSVPLRSLSSHILTFLLLRYCGIQAQAPIHPRYKSGPHLTGVLSTFRNPGTDHARCDGCRVGSTAHLLRHDVDIHTLQSIGVPG